MFDFLTTPKELRQTPTFQAMFGEARAVAERQRTAIAADMDTAHATYAKALPKLERQLADARAAHAAAWTRYQDACRELWGADSAVNNHHARHTTERRRAEKQLTALAHPAVAAALRTIDNALEAHRHIPVTNANRATHTARHTALGAARNELAPLLITAGVDAAAAVARVLDTLSLAIPEDN